jgi:protein-S-isoprenylcysteine O-methyltransferase Ste14
MKRYTPFLLAVPLGFALWAQVVVVHGGVWHWQFTVGLVLIVPSFILWALARYQLGDAFTPRAEARKLVTNGLYARIRHPIYIFAECMAVGIIVFMRLPWLFIVWIPAVGWQVIRAKRENLVLEQRFGDEYRRYRSRTWF